MLRCKPLPVLTFFETDLAKIARIGFGLASNHAFLDGNKRIGAMMTQLLLKWNGYVVALHVSIHALVRVRRKCQTSPARIHGFNPRTRESATCLSRRGSIHGHVSIHALVRVRQEWSAPGYDAEGFQSTHS